MSVVKWKILKPATLKQKEMRLELLNALRASAKEVERLYKQTTAGWTHQVKFETVIALSGSKPEFLVGTNDEIYQYVDEGTRPHMIVPVKAKVLRFSTGGSPKTRPNVLSSSSGSSGSNVVYSKMVFHPGTKARNFSKLINSLSEKKFKSNMHEAMRRARLKSGHAI